MSKKTEDDQQIIVDKIRSNYPDLTLNDCCGGKPSFSSHNTLSVSAQPLNISTVKTNSPRSIVPNMGSQNFDTTCSELKQAIGNNNLPPYTNATNLKNQNPVRVPKVTSSKNVNKAVQPKFTTTREKSTSTAVIEPIVSASPIITSSKSVTICSVPGDKIVSSSTMPGNEDISLSLSKSKNVQESVVQLQSNKNPIIAYKSEVIEKNIHKKVLTVTPCSNNGNKSISGVPNAVTSVKDTKSNSVNVVSKNVASSLPVAKNNIPPKENLLKQISKNVSVRTELQKNEPVKGNSSNNLSKPVIINTSELASKNILSKTVNMEKKEMRVPVTSPVDNNVRNSDLISKCISSKSVSATQASKINPKTTTINVTSNSPTTLPRTATLSESAIQVPNRLTLSMHISAISESRELMEALNSGSNVNLTESVTISNQTMPIPAPAVAVEYMVLQAVPEQKLKMNNEASVQTISKQINTLPAVNVRNNSSLSPGNSRNNSNPSPSNVRNTNPNSSPNNVANPRNNPNPISENIGNPRHVSVPVAGNPGNPANPRITSNPSSANPGNSRALNPSPGNPGTPRNIGQNSVSNMKDLRSKVNISEVVGLSANPDSSSSHDVSSSTVSSFNDFCIIGSSSPSRDNSKNLKDTSSVFLSSDDTDNNESCSLKRKMDEPECLTISSDEEIEESEPDTSDLSESIINKEPIIDKDDDKFSINDPSLRVFDVCTDGSLSEQDFDNLLDVTNKEGYTNLNCRTVRIGSYKVTPRASVTLSQYGLRMVIPVINNVSENVVLKIPIYEIIRVLIHFGRQLPVIFYYVSVPTGTKVRNALNMIDNGEFYFDPASSDESQRRITLLPEKFSEASKGQIAKLYLEREILAELNLKEANQLLVRSAPREVQKVIKQVPPNPVQTIMVYPPPPAKGGISINTEDYSCLAEDVFLNDVIIDFYLKYLYNQELSEEDKQKTHIFSSFFYKRLTDKATPIPRHLQNSKGSDSTVTAAEIRHSRVKNWTKNIDIFSKDYIIIPLNENQHWFLAIICFPGLKGPVTFNDEPIEVEKTEIKVESTAESSSNIDKQTITIGSTTITPLRVECSSQKYSNVDDDNEGEDRDEADGADEDVNLYLNTSEESEEEYSEIDIASSGDVKPKVGPRKREREPIKQPCILIFDSLAGASRARIIATLRDYLRIEYKMKHKEDRDFSKNVVKGACPKVPQQTNYTDCGLFVLQYVETFFESKITDFHIPIKTLRYWFDPEGVASKRYRIQQLLHVLMRQQHIDVESLNLPLLHLSPRSDYDSDECYGDDGDSYDHYEEEGELGNPFEYDDLDVEDIEEHNSQRVHLSRTYADDSDEAEYMEDEEHYSRCRFGFLDSDPEEEEEGPGIEGESEEEYSDGDIMYKDLENLEVMKAERHRGTDMSQRMKVGSDEPTTQEEDDSDEQMISNERLCGINTEDVTISRAVTISATSITRTRSLSGIAGDQSSSGVTTSDKNQLAALKAARPFGDLDSSSDSGCSSSKKFRSN